MTELTQSPPEGIKVFLNEEDVTDIQASIEGPGIAIYLPQSAVWVCVPINKTNTHEKRDFAENILFVCIVPITTHIYTACYIKWIFDTFTILIM